ncbi:MAG: alpha/beta hydrolase [Chitinophagaceae bacterium]|nr:alpha/beta hydrolase [Chitinophagaceae bacterium]MBL0054619.1 alpha/beta hydrolase [Chitinophagaceae bacterium]
MFKTTLPRIASPVFFSGLMAVCLLMSSCIKETPGGGGGTGGGGTGGGTQIERIILDTAYGSDPKQKMDVYLPAGRTTATKLIILIHGGGWEAGDKSDMNYYKNILRAKWPEAAIANVNYRLASNAANIHHTQIMGDISSAVNFILNNKTQFVVSDSLLMVGASAGAHLAMLYTYAYNTGNKVRAVADFFGPAVLDDWSWYNSFNIWIGKPIKDLLIQYNNTAWNVPVYQANSPFSTATATSRPTIIFHGTIDVIVPLYQSQWLRGRLNSIGVPNEYYEYLDGHGFNTGNTDDAMNKTVNFFKTHLQ